MGKGIENRTTRKLLLGSASALAIGFAFTHSATAAPCGSGSNITIVAACRGGFDWTGGDFAVTSSGSISGAYYGVGIYSAVGNFSNAGSISGTGVAVGNSFGTIGTITNSGAIVSSGYALSNGGILTLLTNTGTIDGAQGLLNAGPSDRIGTVNNSGLIHGALTGVYSNGTIGAFTNSGTISGNSYAIQSYGPLGPITNSGRIEGNIGIVSALTISGGSGGTVGTLTGLNGSIGTVSGAGLVFDTGSLLIHDKVGSGVTVAGTGGTLFLTGEIGASAAKALVLNVGASLVTLSNSGTVKIHGSSATGILNNGSIGTLTNTGTIDLSGTSYGEGIVNLGHIGTLTNNGTITGTVPTGYGIETGGSVDLLENTGIVSFSAYTARGIRVGNGTVGTLSNSGLVEINGASGYLAYGVEIGETASIGTFRNAAAKTISAYNASYAIGVYNTGLITSFDNAGLIHALGTGMSTSIVGWGNFGVANYGSIVSFTNSGLIESSDVGLYNAPNPSVTGTATGVIGTLANSGTIQGLAGLVNAGTITLLNNTSGGSISGTSSTGLYSYTDIGTLTNAGTISGGYFGVNLRGDTSIMTNTIGGLISGLYGMTISGVLHALSNSGIIHGDSATGLANEGAIGTLTNTGLIEGGAGISNSGTITLLTNGTIGTIHGYGTGISISAGEISTLTNDGLIEGVTGLNNGAVINALTNNGVIQGASTGLSNGGSIGTVTNNGLITGQSNALANAGTLTLVNNATIAGGIYNSKNLTISGGSNGTVGTLTGINGGLGDVNGTLYFGTGALLLHDAFKSPLVVVGLGGTLTNTGSFASRLSISSGGTLALFTNDATMSVSGSTGAIANSGRIDKIVNSGTISGGTAIKPATGSSISVISNTGTISGGSYAFNNLGSIDRIENDGEISAGAYAFYNRATGTISTFVNNASGTLTGTINGIYSLGTLGIENHGLISSNRAIVSSGTITSLTNSGTIRGSGDKGTGVQVSGGTVTALTNLAGGLIEGTASGTAWGTGLGLDVSRTIVSLSNFGTIRGSNAGIYLGNSAGRVTSLVNNGEISGGATGIFSIGGIHSLTNSGVVSGAVGISGGTDTNGYNGWFDTVINEQGGTIRGTDYAIYASGPVGNIQNSGLISGNIFADNWLTIAGGSGTVFGTLSGGTITSYVELNAGNTRLADDVVGMLAIEGGIVQLDSHVTVTGSVVQGGGVLDFLTGGELIVNGDAHFARGLIVVEGLSSSGNYAAGDQVTLIVGDDTSDYSGVGIQFSVPGVSATTTVVNGDLIAVYSNSYIGGTLGDSTITGNNGGGDYGYYIGSTGSIGSLTNNGTLNGNEYAFYNSGTIGTFENNGQIVDGTGFANAGLIGVLTNNAVISGGNGLANFGTIDTLTNAAGGVITGTTHAGIYNTGSIGSLTNSGTITGPVYAIDNSGSLGLITNSGTIAGNIRSTSTLSIAGATGATYGVLSGGTITADVAFTAGNLRLSDAVVGQVSNSGAPLQLGASLTITGAYSQTAGTLDLGSNVLTVSGKASISGGTVSASLPSAANYLVGQSITLIDAAAGSSYAGATVSLTPITGLATTATTASTEDLANTFGNDYIGASLASLSNTGTLSGAAYGVYVASGGNLGALANSGTIRGTQYAIYSAGSLGTITNTGLISGNIRSTGQLVLAGTGGTLSGGTITATGVSIAGSLKLADAINVGSGTVSAGTASVELPSKISITGNYLQTGGVLISDVTDTTTYGALAVSGSATITNTTITLNGSTFRAGQTYTIVDAGAASNYSGDTIRLSGAGHFRLKLSTVGDDLLALIRPMFGEIGTAKGGAAAVVGGVLDRVADANGLPDVVDRLSALPDDDLGKALAQAAPAEVGGGVASLQRVSLIEDLIGTAVSNHRSAATGWSVWQEALGGAAKRDAASGAAGYDTTAFGLVLGVDNRVKEGLLVGAALSWSAGWNAGRGDVSGHANGVNGFALTGYGRWTEGALTLNGRVAAGLDHYKQHRTLTALNEKAEADYSGQHYVIAADGSYDFNLAPGVTLSPQASLRWLRLATGSYSETGFGALTVGSVIADQVQSGLGAKLAWTIDTRFGVVAPEIRAAWLHDFLDDPGETNAVLGGLSFTTTSARISANGIRVGTGLTFYHSDATSLRLEYDGEFRDDYTAHGGMLQLSLKL